MSDLHGDPCTSFPTWATRSSSAATAESLTALAGVDSAALDGKDLVDAIVASEKALSLLSGTQMRLLAAFAQPFVAGDPMRLAARLARKNCANNDESDEMVQALVPDAAISLASAEVAAALRISPVTAGIRVREAATMTTVLAPTLDALENGVLDRGKARIIAEHCDPLSPEDKAAVQELVLPLADAATTSELRDLTGQAVITVDPDGCDERHQAAAARRELAIKALPDAMATLKAFLPADGAVKIFQLADLLATATAGAHGDSRGIGARRIDAWVDIADQLLTIGSLDLSHYLGNPLPDHGTPPARPGAESRQPVDDQGLQTGSPTGHDTSLTPETGSPGRYVSTGTGSATGPRVSTSTSPGFGAATDTDDLGKTSADRSNPSQPNEANGRHPNTTIDVEHNSETDAADVADLSTDQVRNDTPRVTSTLDCPGPTSGSHADGNPVPERVTSPFSAEPVKTSLRAAAGKPTAQPVLDKPCGACGSIGQGERSLTRQGRRPHLSVTLGLGTLAGLDNLPGKLAGFGAIPPGLARSIAKSAATITALLTDPETGSTTNAGALVYRPRQELRDQIAALLDTCQFPSCRQPVWRCDIDHREPFDHQNPEQGGQTTLENTRPYCRRHHLFKHHTEWQTRPDPISATLIWISPTGHRYVKGRSQAAPPDIWVSTGGTDLAERLDNMKATADVDHGTRAPGSVPEELLTAMLLQKELNRPPFEYDPAVRECPPANSAVTEIAVTEIASNESVASDRAIEQRGSAHGNRDVPESTAPNAESWPTIEDPPPF